MQLGVIGLGRMGGEGFDILRNKRSQDLPQAERYDLDLMDVAEVWRRGSVASSWLLDLTAQAPTGGAA
jgi:6-phosphogluconate dehydrogenase